MDPVKGTHGIKFSNEMLPTALVCQSKAPKVLMQSDMPLGLRSSAKKGTVISSIQADELFFKKAHYRTAPKHKVCAALYT